MFYDKFFNFLPTYILIIILVALALIIFLIFALRSKTFEQKQKPKQPEYDEDGYNSFGYNRLGRNKQNQYNRFFDKSSAEEEGFLNPNLFPIKLTNHARDRFEERLGINNQDKMYSYAYDAYKFGKTKRQIKKTSAAIIDEIEYSHNNSILIVYHGYIYIFSKDNILITVFRNDRIPL